MTQDDAHIFCTEDQIAEELDGCIAYLNYLYDLFDLKAACRVLDAARTTSSAATRSGTSRRATSRLR